MPDYSIPVPKESQTAFWAYQNKSPQNPGLIFDRFMPDWVDHADELKEKGFKSTKKAAEQADGALLAAWNTRWEKTMEAAQGKSFPLQTDWRLIAGLGRKGSLEVGFTFHRYGFPYLPGSSLKGLARTWGLVDIASRLGESRVKSLCEQVNQKERLKEALGVLSALEVSLSREKEDDFLAEMKGCGATPEAVEMGKRFRAIFGTTEHSGHVLFFDAIPQSKPRLELDIMNPHYPDYYKEVGNEHPEVYPTDWQSPNPVKFLAVAPGTVFRFAVGWRRAPIDTISLEALPTEKERQEWSWFKVVTTPSPGEPNDLLKLAKAWLEKGLLELGAGGKTSGGYGYFREPGAGVDSQPASSSERRALPPGYERGVVKEFGLGPSQSYGFIARSSGADLFVHRNNLVAGLTHLNPGQRVIFKVGRGSRGPQAIEVQADE